jgi:hypothetical protein
MRLETMMDVDVGIQGMVVDIKLHPSIDDECS